MLSIYVTLYPMLLLAILSLFLHVFSVCSFVARMLAIYHPQDD